MISLVPWVLFDLIFCSVTAPRHSLHPRELPGSLSGHAHTHLRDLELAVPLPSNAFPLMYEWLAPPLLQVFPQKLPSHNAFLVQLI